MTIGKRKLNLHKKKEKKETHLSNYIKSVKKCINKAGESIVLSEKCHFNKKVNPLSPNSDQHQISPGSINAYSTPEVMRIKDMITQDKFS